MAVSSLVSVAVVEERAQFSDQMLWCLITVNRSQCGLVHLYCLFVI